MTLIVQKRHRFDSECVLYNLPHNIASIGNCRTLLMRKCHRFLRREKEDDTPIVVQLIDTIGLAYLHLTDAEGNEAVLTDFTSEC